MTVYGLFWATNGIYRIYSEHLDTALFPDPKFQAAQSAWLKNKYRDRKSISSSRLVHHHKPFFRTYQPFFA